MLDDDGGDDDDGDDDGDDDDNNHNDDDVDKTCRQHLREPPPQRMARAPCRAA